jgi:hypothetical protein
MSDQHYWLVKLFTGSCVANEVRQLIVRHLITLPHQQKNPT